MTAIVDTHAHLDLSEFEADRDAVLARARMANVAAVVLIGFSPERWRTTASLCARYPHMVRAVGVHPNAAAGWSNDVRAALERELARGDAVAVGEIGLDFFREHAEPRSQRAAFEAQLDLAAQTNLPVVIHQRAAETEVLAAIERRAPLRGVLHCFGGSPDFAARVLATGLHLGIGGVATYPKSENVRAAVRAAPLERILLETDAPYLAPHSRRGERNEPAFIVQALRVVAATRQASVEAVATQTTANATGLFGAQLTRAIEAGQKRA